MTDLIHQDRYRELAAVMMNGPMAESTRGRYSRKLRTFLAWWEQNGRQQLTAELVNEYAGQMRQEGFPAHDIGHSLTAIKKLAQAAALRRWIDAIDLEGINSVKGPRVHATRTFNWLTEEQMLEVMKQPDRTTLKGKRDYVVIGLALYCGLRAEEIGSVRFEHIQERDGRPVLVNLIGKGDKPRSVPMPVWLFQAIQEWVDASGITDGYICRSMPTRYHVLRETRIGRIDAWDIVKKYTKMAGVPAVTTHDLRRTFGRVARDNGVELDQIQQSYGHSSVNTTTRYIGGNQKFKNAPCDALPAPK